MPLDPPAPIDAGYQVGPDRVIIDFDHELQADPGMDTTNWTVTLGGVPRAVTGATALGQTVTLILGLGAGPNGVNHVSYSPPPFEVLGTQGAQTVAFLQFPIT